MQNVLRTCALFLVSIGLCLCIGNAACADGEQVIVPGSVTRLEAEAFANCESITSVTIPASVTTIGNGCFSGCTHLRRVCYGGTAEQWTTVSIGIDNAPLDSAKHIFLGGHPASEAMTVNRKSYTASYFGQEDISSWSEKYKTRDFWRLENAYDDFKNLHRIEDNLPEHNYPMSIAAGQVFVIDYTLKSGGVYREVMRCDGGTWEGMLTTHALAVADVPPVRTNILTIDGKHYTASYYGSSPYTQDGHTSREFWRLENAYNDFKNVRFSGSHVPDNNYPMGIEAGQVYVIDYHMENGRSYRTVMRCDGIILGDERLDSQAIAADSPIYTEILTINGKAYTASYFGPRKLPDSDERYSSREFWRLENAYEDFKNCAFANDNLPESNYPMAIQPGQVFVIDYTRRSGGVFRELMRCDGNTWEGMLTTHAFTAD